MVYSTNYFVEPISATVTPTGTSHPPKELGFQLIRARICLLDKFVCIAN
jgi:hypothetical protein